MGIHLVEETEDKIRGSYMRILENVEFLVCEILATHFFSSGAGDTKNRRVDLLQIILRRSNIRFNIEALRYLLKRRYPVLWAKYSKTIRALDKILAHRNLLVHSSLGLADELLPKDDGTLRQSVFRSPSRILLVGFTKGNVRFSTITMKQHQTDLADAEKVCTQLVGLWKEVLASQKPKGMLAR